MAAAAHPASGYCLAIIPHNAQTAIRTRNRERRTMPVDFAGSFFRNSAPSYVIEKARMRREMADTVMVEIPVTREAAEALGDPERRQRVGKLVSSMLRPRSLGDDPLAAI